ATGRQGREADDVRDKILIAVGYPEVPPRTAYGVVADRRPDDVRCFVHQDRSLLRGAVGAVRVRIGPERGAEENDPDAGTYRGIGAIVAVGAATGKVTGAVDAAPNGPLVEPTCDEPVARGQQAEFLGEDLVQGGTHEAGEPVEETTRPG